MNSAKTRIHIERVDFNRYVNLHLITDKFGETFVAEPAVIKERKFENGYDFADPFVRFTEQQAQQLMEGLWRAGFRPNNGESSVAHVDAMKYHLEDMRRLVFKAPPGEDTRETVIRVRNDY